MACQALYKLFTAQDDATLRSSEKLIAAETDQVYACLEFVCGGRSTCPSVG